MNVDVAIIGASLAGSVAAHILGQEGVSVALIDKCTFPRRKPCGEGLSRSGLLALKRLGLWPDEAPVSFLPYSGYQIFSGASARLLTPSSGGGITLRREDLDLHLFTKASSHDSVIALPGETVTAISTRKEVTTPHFHISPRLLFIADGSNSPSARHMGLPTQRLAPARRGASAIFRGSFSRQPHVVSIFVQEKFELYCTPLPEGRLNLSVLTGINSGVNVREVLLSPRYQHLVFERVCFEGALEQAPLGRSPIGGVRRRSDREGVFLLGDAAEEFDPIGGMGMTHAFRSAEIAANAALVELGKRPQSAVVSYEKRRQRAAQPLRTFTKATYAAMRTSFYYPSVLSLLSSPLGTFISNILFPKEFLL